MLIYALGWSAVFGVFALLHRHALSKREELQLTEVEAFDTRESITTHLAVSGIGLVLAATYFIAYRTPNQREAERITLGMSVVLVGMLVALARRKRRNRGRRRELVFRATAGNEA
jgi:peptidoglycan/LPS O-acetylase OafA/YrhL